MLNFCVALSQISAIYEIVIVTFLRIQPGRVGLILVQQGFLFFLLLFFPSLPKSLAIIPTYCRTLFCLDSQAHIRRLGKVSALQQMIYCKRSGDSQIYVPTAGTNNFICVFLLLYLAEVKPVTPLRSETVNFHSRFFVWCCSVNLEGFLFFHVKGQGNISVSHLDSLKRK